MSLFSLVSLAASGVYIYFAVHVLLLDRRSAVNRVFFLTCLSFSYWALMCTFLHSAPSIEFYRDIFRLSSVGWVMCPALLFHFFLLLTNNATVARRRWLVGALYVAPAVLLGHGFTDHLFARQFVRVPLGWTEVPEYDSPWFWALMLYVHLYIFGALWLCYRWGGRSAEPRNQHQARIMLSTGLLGFALFELEMLGWPGLAGQPVPRLANAFALVWIAGVFWAVVRYRLMVLTPATAAEQILKTMSDAVILVDRRARILSVNRAACELLGYPEEEMNGRPLDLLFRPAEPASRSWFDLALAHTSVRNHEATCRTRAGESIPVMVSASSISAEGGVPSGAVAVLRDVRELKAKEEALSYLAHHDPLTNLPNRLLFYDRLEQALARAERQGRKVGVLFMDLDRFKEVNDTLGHEVGDLLLQNVARRISRCLRSADTVSRMGGDEFALILPDLACSADAHTVVTRINETLFAPVSVGGRELGASCSTGLAFFPDDGTEPEELMKCADMAMYAAKAAGGSTCMPFSRSMGDATVERLRLKVRLRRALEDHQFVVHYQPQVDVVTGEVIGVEALLRWQDPQSGLVPPGSFIATAEETGSIIAIGEWVLREACLEARRWREGGLTKVRVAVNLSPRQFQHAGLVETVRQILVDTHMDPQLLELEVTEHTAMRDAEETVRTLERLRRLGVRIAIDDFGTGYSSLVYLKRFTVDTLKIGQAFIRDVAERSDSAAIVAAIVGLAKALGLDTTIAEGVETQRQLELVRSVHCRVVQGFLFSEPVSAEALLPLLHRERPLVCVVR
jgi:diguanylate cyclase (GGDEF)-like protein/PAS domain S-box-containing protein